MTLKLRLGRLEKRTRPMPDRGGWTPRRFLEVFKQLGEQGYFSPEPDFPKALEQLRAEVEEDNRDCMSVFWILDLFIYRRMGRGPVSEADWVEAAGWYLRNVGPHREQLYKINLSLFVSDGSARVARLPDVTAVYERLQRLRARYPEFE
jgi:hypothetical protein